ncbi:MAG: LytR/AlgR family response regulator transcription factor [Spirosomataceae bacterium]
MKKLRTIVVEDVDDTIATILNIFQQKCPNVEVLGVAKDTGTAYDLIVEHKPDFVLLDVQIIDGTGFDVIQKLKDNEVEITFEFVFMTGHIQKDYATKAFAYTATHYFEKPFADETLVEVVEKVNHRQSENEKIRLYDALIDYMNKSGELSDFIMVHLANRKTRRLDIRQIMYLIADGSMTQILLQNGETVKAFKNLGEYRKTLENNHNFFSIKNSICVNLDYKASYDHSTWQMTLKNGVILQGSKDFCKKYYAFSREIGEGETKRKKTIVSIIKNFLGLKD